MNAKTITLILLRDTGGSHTWLCPAEYIDRERIIVPALTVGIRHIAELREDAVRLAQTQNFCGTIAFRYAVAFDSDEFLLQSHSQELCDEVRLIAETQQIDLPELSQRLCDGITLWELLQSGAQLPPTPDRFTIIHNNTFNTFDKLSRVLINALRHDGKLFDTTIRRLSDGALVHHSKQSLPHAAELLRRGLYDIEQIRQMTAIDMLYIQAMLELLCARRELISSQDGATINAAMLLGFSADDIEQFIGSTSKTQKIIAQYIKNEQKRQRQRNQDN